MDRPRHVFCGGMYRSCSTWQYEVVTHLLGRHADGPVYRLGYLEGPAYHRWASRHPDLAGHPAALKCHDRHFRFTRALARGDALAVYSYRDLRDVVDSMVHKMGMTFEALMRQGLVHRILANDRFWTSRPGVVVQRYEDIIADPPRAVAELAAHLGLELADGEAREVAARYSLQANRQRIRALGRPQREDDHGRSIRLDPAGDLFDPATLLHWNHLRDGGAGGWRDRLNDRQAALIDRLGGRWLSARGYERSEASTREWTNELLMASLRSRMASTIYFAARRYPAMTELPRRLMGSASGPVPDSSATSASQPSREPVTSRS